MLKKIFDKKQLVATSVIILLFGILTITNYQFAKANAGGSDFVFYWEGARNFFLNGTSPYSDDTALKIQEMIYGQPAKVGESQLRFAYPLYTIFLFAPFALFNDFTLARAIWMSILEICLFSIAFYSIRLTFWKPKVWLITLLIVFSFISYHGMRPLINGNAVILITFLLVLILTAIRNKNDEVAGILLALITIKPQNSILFIAFILIWAVINHRNRIITYFLGAMVLLVGFSVLLIPDWIAQNFREVFRYVSYDQYGSVGAVLQTAWGAIGQRFSVGITVILTTLLLVEWWAARNAGIRHFLWTAFLTIAVSQWVGIQTDPGNFILLYPGVIYCFYQIADRWGPKSNAFFIIFNTIVTIGIWVIFLVTLNHSYQPLQSPIMFFPMPLIAFALLYWVRWWVIESGKLELNQKSLGI